MRHRFEQQLSLGVTPISEVEIRTKSRDEMPPLMVALQTIFVTEVLNEKVFAVLEECICKNKKATGRPGMNLWHILVLSLVRHACNTNWDKLHHFANNDMTMRNIMGLHNNQFGEGFHEFEYQNILDNVSLLEAETIDKINLIVVGYGMKLLKKKEDEALQLKADSFVVETNVHLPTDLNLLNDSIRTSLSRVEKLIFKGVVSSQGWRKIKSTKNSFKSLLRATSWAVFKGKREDYKTAMVKKYITQAQEIEQKLKHVLANYHDEELEKYTAYITLFINQIERRLLKGEVIPPQEKVFSIFEDYTEWINKGKRSPELGNALLITTNQYQLIMDYKIMFKEKDVSQIVPLLGRLKTNFPSSIIDSLSTDKGFWSKDNFASCVKSEIKNIIMPKKGKRTKAEYEREHQEIFVRLRNKHSAVESNINMLEHRGLNRCMDKGKPHFERYVSLSVLAYNLHIVGKELVRKKLKKEKRAIKAAKAQRYKQAA